MPRRNASRSPRRRVHDDGRTPGLGSHYRADGTAKVSYMSRGEAHLVADERRAETGNELEVYRCSACAGWHLGNPREDDGERRTRL